MIQKKKDERQNFILLLFNLSIAGEETLQSLTFQLTPLYLLHFLDFCQAVVVSADSRIVDLFESDNNRVADSTLVNRDNLASLAVPVRFRAENTDLQCELFGNLKLV